MDWKSISQNEQGLIKVPKRWLYIHYYEALNILFRFENSMRVFVYAILKNEFSDKWKEISFSIPGSDPNTIKGIAAKRISQAESFGYLGYDIKAPLMHLTSGELVELITSDAYWPKFKSYFKGDKNIIKNKLLEIGTIRNSLAHFRPIKADDIELVKQNTRHTLLDIEKCLTNIFDQTLRVPTNTPDEWYKSISTLGTDQITTTPFYSTDEAWINVQLKFHSPILSKSRFGDNWYSFILANINTPNILLNHEELTKHLTYLSEMVSYPDLTTDFDINIYKTLHFVFRKDVLVKNHASIGVVLREILQKIMEECDLLRQDNLARGSIVETARVTSWWSQAEGETGRWNHNYFEILKSYQSNHPDEYWGQTAAFLDFVAGCSRYPWMPADISSWESFLD